MVNKSYLEVFKEALEKNNLDASLGPNYFASCWEEFISACKDCYQFSSSEFDYDILIRNDIESLLRTRELEEFEEFNFFKESVSKLDDKFKELLHPVFEFPIETQYWWQKKVLKYAGKKYAEQIKNHFGFNIQVLC
jgi:hypothetical protein